MSGAIGALCPGCFGLLEQAADCVPGAEDEHGSDEGGDRNYEQHEPRGFVPLVPDGIKPPVVFWCHITSLTQGGDIPVARTARTSKTYGPGLRA